MVHTINLTMMVWFVQELKSVEMISSLEKLLNQSLMSMKMVKEKWLINHSEMHLSLWDIRKLEWLIQWWLPITRKIIYLSRLRWELSKLHKLVINLLLVMVKKVHAVWPIVKRIYHLQGKVLSPTWLSIHTLSHQEWQLAIWLNVSFQNVVP